jgi:hypothetical protein
MEVAVGGGWVAAGASVGVGVGGSGVGVAVGAASAACACSCTWAGVASSAPELFTGTIVGVAAAGPPGAHATNTRSANDRINVVENLFLIGIPLSLLLFEANKSTHISMRQSD